MTLSRTETLTINKAGWNHAAPRFFGRTALPKYGPLTPTEDELQLIKGLNGDPVLEIGCGSGHSLRYLREMRGAGELWGLDLAEQQIAYAREVLSDLHDCQLYVSSMDEDPGLPKGYFGLVIAVYSLGWTPDLDRTVTLIHSYLKPGGRLIFSWEHPLYSCLDYDSELNRFFMYRSYFQEGPYSQSWKGTSVVFHPRKLSAFVNSLASAGFVVNRLIESEPTGPVDETSSLDPNQWYSLPRAGLVPTTFIIQAQKP